MLNKPEFHYMNKKIIDDVHEKKIDKVLWWIEEHRENIAKQKISFKICDKYYINDISYNMLKNPSTSNTDKARMFDQFFRFMNNLSSAKIDTFSKNPVAYEVKDIVPNKEDKGSDYYKFFNELWDWQLDIKEFIWQTSKKEIANRIFFYILDWTWVINIILIACKHLSWSKK